jgi:hypothetical protein
VKAHKVDSANGGKFDRSERDNHRRSIFSEASGSEPHFPKEFVAIREQAVARLRPVKLLARVMRVSGAGGARDGRSGWYCYG